MDPFDTHDSGVHRSTGLMVRRDINFLISLHLSASHGFYYVTDRSGILTVRQTDTYWCDDIRYRCQFINVAIQTMCLTVCCVVNSGLSVWRSGFRYQCRHGVSDVASVHWLTAQVCC